MYVNRKCMRHATVCFQKSEKFAQSHKNWASETLYFVSTAKNDRHDTATSKNNPITIIWLNPFVITQHEICYSAPLGDWISFPNKASINSGVMISSNRKKIWESKHVILLWYKCWGDALKFKAKFSLSHLNGDWGSKTEEH